MLTKKDLEEIGKVLDETIENKLKPIKKDFKDIKKTLDVGFKVLNRDNTRLEKRVIKIEDSLDLPPQN